MKIRKYQDFDKDNLRNICIATAAPQKNKKGEKLLTLLYNDYYTEHESENCFVLADDNNKAVGYIICSEDFTNYRKIFMKEYMPQVKKLSIIQYLMQLASLYIVEPKICKTYPAHMHIDILPGYTGSGSGSQMIETLFAHLKSKNIKGIMLGVGYNNKKALKFYFRHDLQILKVIPNACFILGKQL